MPAVSIKQRRLMGLAAHNPEKVKAKNRGVLSMSIKDRRDYASTPEKGLPYSSTRVRQVDNKIKRKKIK